MFGGGGESRQGARRKKPVFPILGERLRLCEKGTGSSKEGEREAGKSCSQTLSLSALSVHARLGVLSDLWTKLWAPTEDMKALFAPVLLSEALGSCLKAKYP